MLSDPYVKKSSGMFMPVIRGHFRFHRARAGRVNHRAWTPNELKVSYPKLLVRIIDHLKNLKNQALQGRLVDALAHRGDERRDTLR